MVSVFDNLLPEDIKILRRYIASHVQKEYDLSYLQASKIPEIWKELEMKALPNEVKVVLFDVYGTILATKIGEISTTIDKNDFTVFSPGMDIRILNLIHASHLESKSNGILWPEVDIIEIFIYAFGLKMNSNANILEAAKLCLEWEMKTNRACEMPGAFNFISMLNKNNKPHGIVSNSQFYTPLFLEYFSDSDLFDKNGLGFYKDYCLWSFEEKIAKPDIEMFNRVAKRIEKNNIERRNVLYIGNDPLNDCAIAREAGFMSLLLTQDKTAFKDRSDNNIVKKYPPHSIADSWEKVRSLLCI